jgi:hypothetical protein
MERPKVTRGTRRRSRTRGSHVALFLLVSVLATALLVDRFSGARSAKRPEIVPEGSVSAAGDAAVRDAFRSQRSGVFLEVAGVVERVLPDDLRGNRHQRFILRLASGHTLLISHNIDLAPRVPLSTGDTLQLRGEYRWNAEGGVMHWTHRDLLGKGAGGWIRHREALYR